MEIDEDALEAELKERARRIQLTRAVIEKHAGPFKKGKSSAAHIDCPICGKIEGLYYVRKGINGHIWASCETPGCVRWVE